MSDAVRGKDANLTSMTISITEEDKFALKKHALEQRTSVSGVVRDWIERFCRKPEGKK